MSFNTDFPTRSCRILSAAYARRGFGDRNEWGLHRSFDGYLLAGFATGDGEAGFALLSETLDMVDRNLADEVADPSYIWHLGDFALHPVLRALWQYRSSYEPDDPVWTRAEQSLTGYLYHFGNLSENHNMLHLVLRYLVGTRFPEAQFRDGRSGEAHAREARLVMLDWLADFVRLGTGEWGAALYYNVNLLSLLNLVDLAPEEEIRNRARQVLDLMAFDEALDRFHGAYMGTARRAYSCYRMRAEDSPSRPLQYLWFGPWSVDEAPFSCPWFVGGALIAAVSDYRPPAAAVERANHDGWVASSALHRRSFTPYNPAIRAQQRRSVRGRHAMLSVLCTQGGVPGYTEFSAFMALGANAVVFPSHPPARTSDTVQERTGDGDEPWRGYVEDMPGHWKSGNLPPGVPGERRPGYWQGNGLGPAGVMRDRTGLLVYDVRKNPGEGFLHLYEPKNEFDEVLTEGHWRFYRKEDGYGAVWCSAVLTARGDGDWAGMEVYTEALAVGFVFRVGDRDTCGAFGDFMEECRACSPGWDSDALHLRVGDLEIDSLGREPEGPRIDTGCGSFDPDHSSAWSVEVAGTEPYTAEYATLI